MPRRRTLVAAMIVFVMGLWIEDATAQAPRAAVIVHNRASMPADVIHAARQIVNGIYARARIALVWFHATPRLTNVPFDGQKIRIVIVSREAADAIRYPADALGFTPGHAGRNGGLAYILEHRVRAVAKGYRTPRSVVLGTAIAHEIGHVLLPRDHTATGLMRSVFNQSDFRSVARGELLFTPNEASEIRARLTGAPIDLRAAASKLSR